MDIISVGVNVAWPYSIALQPCFLVAILLIGLWLYLYFNLYDHYFCRVVFIFGVLWQHYRGMLVSSCLPHPFSAVQVFSDHRERCVEVLPVGEWRAGEGGAANVIFDADVTISVFDYVALFKVCQQTSHSSEYITRRYIL